MTCGIHGRKWCFQLVEKGIEPLAANPPQLAELYDRYGYLVFRRAVMFLGSEAEAEDACQEVFIKAMRNLEGFRGESAVSTWLYRITTNHCLNLLRSRKRQKRRMEKEKQRVDFQSGLPHARLEEIRQLLPSFDRRTQQAVWAYFVDEMKQSEVAEALGISVPTVRKVLDRFVRKARRRLEGESARD